MDRIAMAESIGIGWRLESESGGGLRRNTHFRIITTPTLTFDIFFAQIVSSVSTYHFASASSVMNFYY